VSKDSVTWSRVSTDRGQLQVWTRWRKRNKLRYVFAGLRTRHYVTAVL